MQLRGETNRKQYNIIYISSTPNIFFGIIFVSRRSEVLIFLNEVPE